MRGQAELLKSKCQKLLHATSLHTSFALLSHSNTLPPISKIPINRKKKNHNIKLEEFYQKINMASAKQCSTVATYLIMET